MTGVAPDWGRAWRWDSLLRPGRRPFRAAYGLAGLGAAAAEGDLGGAGLWGAAALAALPAAFPRPLLPEAAVERPCF